MMSTPAATAVDRAVDGAFDLQLGTTTRTALDAQVDVLVAHMKDQLGSPLASTERFARLREEGEFLLAGRPKRDALSYSVYAHMRALARVLRRLRALSATASGSDAENPAVTHPVTARGGGG
ncbi:hypothetical protein [Streptomyces sp. NPDC094049]|uniref:hypothetical protein n=1 Tax=Streptomyces sp. NPDC094049 TaxID=3154987 RepID=UPI00332BE992